MLTRFFFSPQVSELLDQITQITTHERRARQGHAAARAVEQGHAQRDQAIQRAVDGLRGLWSRSVSTHEQCDHKVG